MTTFSDRMEESWYAWNIDMLGMEKEQQKRCVELTGRDNE